MNTVISQDPQASEFRLTTFVPQHEVALLKEGIYTAVAQQITDKLVEEIYPQIRDSIIKSLETTIRYELKGRFYENPSNSI